MRGPCARDRDRQSHQPRRSWRCETGNSFICIDRYMVYTASGASSVHRQRGDEKSTRFAALSATAAITTLHLVISNTCVARRAPLLPAFKGSPSTGRTTTAMRIHAELSNLRTLIKTISERRCCCAVIFVLLIRGREHARVFASNQNRRQVTAICQRTEYPIDVSPYFRVYY